MKKTNFKTKILAVALAAVTTCSVGTMAMTTTVYASDADLSAGTTITSDLRITMDKDLMTVTKLTSGTIFKILEQCTPYGKFFTPALSTLLDTFLGTPADQTQQKLDEINDKIDKLFDKIDAAEKSMKSAIETDLGLQSFYEAFVKFSGKTEKMNQKISSIMNENLDNANKLAKIASLTGNYSEWGAYFEDVLAELNKLYQKPSITSGESVFDLIYTHFCNDVMFSGEALDKAKPICDYLMQTYSAGCAALLESLSAQLYVNCLTDETKATIDPDYMSHICKDTYDIEQEIESILRPLVGKGAEKTVGVTHSKWMSAYDIPTTTVKYIDYSGTFKALYDITFSAPRTTLVDKGHTELRLDRYLVVHDHKEVPYPDGNYYTNEAKLTANWFNKYVCNGQINADYVKDIANYAKSKGISIRTLLDSNGFCTAKIPANTYIVTSNSWEDVTNTAKSIAALYCYQKTYYNGINIDSTSPDEETIQVLDCGYNAWKGMQEWNFIKDGTACRFQTV